MPTIGWTLCRSVWLLPLLCASTAAHGWINGWAIDGDWANLPRPVQGGGPAPISSTRRLDLGNPTYELKLPEMACGIYNGGVNATVPRSAKPGSAISIWWLSNVVPANTPWIHHEGPLSI